MEYCDPLMAQTDVGTISKPELWVQIVDNEAPTLSKSHQKFVFEIILAFNKCFISAVSYSFYAVWIIDLKQLIQ